MRATIMKCISCIVVCLTIMQFSFCAVATTSEDNEESLIGQSLFFGHYEQDYYLDHYPEEHLDNGTEPIEWVILEANDTSLMLVSKYPLTTMAYTNSESDVSWENSSLRSWLNNEFLQEAFFPDESAVIEWVDNNNGKDQHNAYWVNDGAASTHDRVYILSYQEYQHYASDKAVELSDYFLRDDVNEDCWLRSPGKNQREVSCEKDGGIVSKAATDICGIRPVIWISDADYDWDHDAYNRRLMADDLLYSQEKYTEAMEIFDSLGNYWGSHLCSVDCRMLAGEAAFYKDGDFSSALTCYTDAKNFIQEHFSPEEAEWFIDYANIDEQIKACGRIEPDEKHHIGDGRILVCPNCNAVLNDQEGFDPYLRAWKCTVCNTVMVKDEDDEMFSFNPETAFEGARFPGWYWYCDNCDAFLNSQEGFDDHLDSWKCTICGYETPISAENTYDSPEIFLNSIGRAYPTDDGKSYIISPRIYESDTKFAFQNVGEKSVMSFGSYSLGNLCVSGEVKDVTSLQNQAAFNVGFDGLSIGYNYSGELLKGADEEWHLASCSQKTVDGIKLDHTIGTGCMIIQTSLDGESYTTVSSIGNIMSDYPTGSTNLYSPSEAEVLSGTFFRVIVAYQTHRKTGESNVLFIRNEDFENRFHVEVYEFYLGYDEPFVGVFSMPKKESTVQLESKIYENSKEYRYENDAPTNKMAFGFRSLGIATINGQISNANTSLAVPTVTIPDETIFTLSYDYKDILGQDDNVWELTGDNTKKVADIDLGSKMGMGAIIYQISSDNKEWHTDHIVTDAFKDYDAQASSYSLYMDKSSEDGIYCRVIVAYQTRRKTDSNQVLFVTTDNYEYLKHVEVYTLYIERDAVHPSIDIWDEKNPAPICGFEIWRYGTQFNVTVDGTPFDDGDKVTTNGEYTVTVTTPMGKTDSRIITVENGYDRGSFPDDEEEADIDQLRGDIQVQTHHFDAVSSVNTGKDNGFANAEIIKTDDPHFGWSLGHFTISGFSYKEKDENGNWTFYRVPGDSGEEYDDNIVLQFNLREDIDALRGNNTMKIASDTDTKDLGFQYQGNPFGRGTLLVKHEKPDGSIGETQQYTSYLDAKESINANTCIEINEEGDYQIALDYEIQSRGVLNAPVYNDYRIYLTFKVRNGNCTVYAFDLNSGMELENGAATEDGFRLDLAKSNYLMVTVRRDKLVYGADGQPTLNTSFNGLAKDGMPYTESGLYTVTAIIPSTGHQTEKQIFVGTVDEYEEYLSLSSIEND